MGLLHRAEPHRCHRKCLDDRNQLFSFLPGDLVDLGIRRNARKPHCHRDQLPGEQLVQGIGKVLVDELLKVPEQTGIQLLDCKPGLEVNLHGVFPEIAGSCGWTR